MSSPDAQPDAGDDSDAALMLRFQAARDFEAFQTLFDRNKTAFLGYLRSLTGNSATAEDISQHCWLRLIELAKRNGYRATQGASFRTFLFTLGRNRFLDEYVRKHEVAKRLDTNVDAALEAQPDAHSQASDPQRLLASAEGRQALLRAVDALPLEQREVIALWTAGASIKEMVALTGAPRDTVLSRKKYALTKLRQSLGTASEAPT